METLQPYSDFQPAGQRVKKTFVARSRGLLEGEVCLLLHHTTSVLGVLAKHGPRAFGGAFAVGLDGIELFVR